MNELTKKTVDLPLSKRMSPFIFFGLAACGLYASSLYSFLLFHTLVEMFCIFVLLSIFLLSWNARHLLNNHYFLFLALSFLPSGAFELAHTLAYKGFGVFPGYDANLPTQLWIVFRYVFSLSLLVAPVFISRRLNSTTLILAFAAGTGLLFAAVFSGNFPDCFIEGKGLTPFKIFSEYIIIVILLGAIGLLLLQRSAFDTLVLRRLIIAILYAAVAEAAFTQYLSVFGRANLVGHFFLFLSAFMLYLAIVVPSVKEPATILYRDLEMSQKALRTSEERLRFALETCHIGAWDLDLADHTAFRSLEHDRIFGYPELLPEWTLEMFLEHALPEYRAEVEAMVRAATAAKTGWTYQCPIRRVDGEIRWLWFSGNYYTDSSGHDRVAGIVQDITGRKLEEEKLQAIAAELHRANIELENSRHAAINLMEDALAARQQAEETAARLQESEHRLRTLSDQIPGGAIYQHVQHPDRTMRFAYMSAGIERLFGMPAGEILTDPAPFMRLIVEEDRPRLVRAEEQSARDLTLFDCEFRQRTVTGEVKWVQCRSIPSRLGDGSIAWDGVVMDITERKQVEEALARAHAQTESARRRLEAILETIPVGVVLIDAANRFTLINRRAAEIYGTGYDGADLAEHIAQVKLLKPDGTAFPWEELPVNRAWRGEVSHNVEMSLVRANGVRVPIVVNTVPLQEAGDKGITAVVAFDDISERKRAEEALHESLDRLEKVLEVETVGVMFWDLNTGCLVDANDTFLKLMGYSRRDVETRELTWQKFTPPEYHEVSRAEVRKFMATGRVGPYEKEYFRKDGTRQWLLFAGSSLGNNQCVEFCVDISEQKRTEQALQDANNELAHQMAERTRELREKEVLLKEVHHRVKNNLQVISSLVSLQASGSKDETVREVLREVTYRVRSMALVHEKLYQSASLAFIDFAEYAKSLLNYLWRGHGEVAASVRLTLDLEPVALPVDIAVPCGLILNELAGNALKHGFTGRSEGEVTLSLRTLPEERVLLCLGDNGIGLPPDLDWKNASSLGLRLVQMLAGQLRATVELRREGGTEFRIVFNLPQTATDGGPLHG